MKSYVTRSEATGAIAIVGGSDGWRRGDDVVADIGGLIQIVCVMTSMSRDDESIDSHPSVVGTIVRRAQTQDRWLSQRLSRRRVYAIRCCQQSLVDHGDPSTLLDIEQSIDGGTIRFHFVGPSPDASRVDALTRLFETATGSDHLAAIVATGCGPGCGTAAADGAAGSCSNCASCGGCGVKTRSESKSDNLTGMGSGELPQ